MASSASISSARADHKTSAPRRAHQPDQRQHSASDLLGAAREIALSHGSLVWVLNELGFSGGTSRATFNSYIKSLRKLGIPFFTSELGLRPNQPAVYSYEHTMELSVALSMRFYFAIPDLVLQELKRWRPRLYPLYRSALAHRDSGRGAEVPVKAGAAAFTMCGIFLDPLLMFAGGRLIRFGPPTALSPAEALRRFATLPIADRTSLPIPLTDLAIEVVRLAAAAPVIRRGPRRQNFED